MTGEGRTTKRRLRPVEVRWTDSASTHGWRQPKDLPRETGTTEIRSIGYLVHRDARVTKIVQSRHADEGEYLVFVAEVLSIPSACVRRVTPIRGLAR